MVTIMPGVGFKFPYSKLTVSFASNKEVSLAQVGNDILILDGVGVGGYINDPGFSAPWIISIVSWSGSGTQQDTLMVTYNVTATPGVVAHLNVTGYYAYYVFVEGVDKTANIWRISDTQAMLNWTFGDSSSHQFVWTLISGNPNFIGGIDPMILMTNGFYIFTFIAIITLGLVGAWKMKQWRGG